MLTTCSLAIQASRLANLRRDCDAIREDFNTWLKTHQRFQFHQCRRSQASGVHVCVKTFRGHMSASPPSNGVRAASHEGAFRAEDVRVALAVQVLRVALDAVAAVHLGQRRRHVRRRAEEVGVGERAGELHPLLVPVPPQDALHLPGTHERR